MTAEHRKCGFGYTGFLGAFVKATSLGTPVAHGVNSLQQQHSASSCKAIAAAQIGTACEPAKM